MEQPNDSNTTNPPEYLQRITALCEEMKKGKTICDSVYGIDEIDGEDGRRQVLIDLLTLACNYASFLTDMTGQEEYDDRKDCQVASAISCAYESCSYLNASIRIREVIQQVNRDQNLAVTYFYDRYREDLEDNS
jgi:hypothetical protein